MNLQPFHTGVDLGQRVDHMAVVVSEVERLTHAPEFGASLVTTAFDATGIGAVVNEDLRRRRLKGELYPLVITCGLEGK